MSGFKVRLVFDKSKVAAKVEAARDRGIAEVGNEALKDANYYAREDSSTLIKSSIIASKPEKGRLVWDTPYAKRMYYTGHPSTDTNPNASLMWAHKGFAENHKKYDAMLEKALNEEV